MVNMTSPGRYQGPDLNLNAQLQPAPIVQGVMVNPVNRDGAGSSLMKLADSLSQLGAPLAGLRKTLQANQIKDQKQQAQADQFLPPEVIQANIQNNPKKYGNEYYTAMAGRAAGNNIGPMIDQWVATEWDSTKEDYKTFVSRKLQEHQQTLPTKEAQAAFGETASAWLDQSYTKYQNTVTQTSEMNRDNLIFSDYNGLIERGKLDKKSPDAIWKDIVTASNENRLFLNLPGANQNAILLSLADKVAESGDVDMAKAILNGTRGADGKTPAVSMIPDLAPKAEAIIQKAEAKYRDTNINARVAAQSELNDMVANGATDAEFKAWATKHNDVLSPDNVAAGYNALSEGRTKLRAKNQWAADGVAQKQGIDQQIDKALLTGEGWNKFPKVQVNSDTTYGSQVEYDVDKRVDEKVNEKVGIFYKTLPPEQADVETAKFLAANNRTSQAWESIFSAVSPAAIQSAAAEGKAPPQLVRAVELYARTSGSFGGVLAQHIKGKDTQQFLDGVTFLMQDMNKTPEEAITLAAGNTFGPDVGARRAAAQQEVASQYKNDNFLNKYDLGAATKIKSIAESLLVTTNARDSDVWKKAKSIFESNNVQVLGTWIPKNDKHIPPNIDTIMTDYAKDWVTAHGNEIEPPITDPAQLSVTYADGRLLLTTKEDGTPIRMPSGKDTNGPGQGFVVITMKDASDFWNHKQEAAASAARADTVKNANSGWLWGLFGGHDVNNPAPSSTGGTASQMYGITSPEQVRTLNYNQLLEVQKQQQAGTLDPKFKDKAYTDLIASEIKKHKSKTQGAKAQYLQSGGLP